MISHEKEIKQLENALRGNKIDRPLRLESMNLLRQYKYENIENKNSIEECKELDDLALETIELGKKIAFEDNKYIKKAYNIARSCYEFRARRHFKEFLIATEWEYEDEMKFYYPRRMVFDDWIKYLQDLEEGNLDGLSISAPPRTGKALSLDSKVLTEDGWKEMRYIEEGDMVIGADGKPSKVIGVFPQGIKDMYKVTFDDGTEVKCSGDHLWTVQKIYRGKIKKELTLNTLEIKKRREELPTVRYGVKLVEPVDFKEKLDEDDIDPYVLGVLLEIGIISNEIDPVIIAKNNEMALRLRFKKGVEETLGGNYRIVGGREKLKEYGLLDGELFIPEKYLYSSLKDRKELIRGLLDSQGVIEPRSSCKIVCYSGFYKKLADDVIELVKGLGGEAHYSKLINRKERFNVSVRLFFDPFYDSEELENYKELKDSKRRWKEISSIERIEDEECQCIYVDNEEHLFVTEGYTLTHNTGIGTKFFEWCMLRHPDRSCFFVSHTNAMAKKVYNDILTDFDNPKARINAIFPEFRVVEKNAEGLFKRQ